MQKCNLCGLDATIQSNMQYFQDIVRCPRCGKYRIEIDMRIPDDQRYILSGLTRQASDAGKPITITSDNMSSLLQSLTIAKNPQGRMDKTLLYVSKQQDRADKFVLVDIDRDYPLAFARDGKEFLYFLETLAQGSCLNTTTTLVLILLVGTAL